jgi:hypothetical protein
MRNKFFFGVVVGFFVAVVAFVVFLFVSGTARAAVLTDSPHIAAKLVNVVDGRDYVKDVAVREEVTGGDIAVVRDVVVVPDDLAVAGV